MTISLVGFGVLLVLVFARIPLAIAMALVGVAGFGILNSWNAAFSMISQIAFDTGLAYGLSVVPLFILMGNFVTQAGLSNELYRASNAFLGHRRGGLAMATVVACGGFSAVCGSSMATAATMAKVAMPSMRKFGYSDSLASGCIAAGGTLGILIPPSVILIIYGILTESDIGQLFAAGIVPGILGIVCYLGAVRATTRINPESGPRGDRVPWSERLDALMGVWGVVLLFVIVIGGIYTGWFTPTEAAGIGAFGAFVFALLKGRLTFAKTLNILISAAKTTAMIFAVLIGATLFANFINLAGMPDALTEWAQRFQDSPFLVVLMVVLIYLVLGCVLESLSMILLTVPVFYPMMASLGFDLIWFGIVVVVVTEISLITPPIGLNVFVLKAVLPDVSTRTIFAGVTPFWIADIVRLSLIILIPSLSLFLPGLLR